jgi:hypothetical protein
MKSEHELIERFDNLDDSVDEEVIIVNSLKENGLRGKLGSDKSGF